MQIFISYSRVDKALAQRLADDLTQNHYTVWLDLHNIAHGANWDLEVQHGLDDSDTMIVLLSPSAVASQNVADEWSYFLEKNKRVIPLMIQPTEVPFRLSRRQRVDFVQGYAQGLAELINALREPAPSLSDSPRGAVVSDLATRPLPVSWSERYQVWRGLVPPLATGTATVTSTELRLFAPLTLPVVIALTSLVSARVQRLPWDTYLALTFIDHGDRSRQLIVMGTQRSARQKTQRELLNMLKLYSGRGLV